LIIYVIVCTVLEKIMAIEEGLAMGIPMLHSGPILPAA